MKKIYKMFLLAPLLMAFQCDDELESSLEFNEFKVNITSSENLRINDTIWITGKISSRVFDTSVGDSIFFNEFTFGDYVSVMKLKEADQNGNSIDAIDRFNIVNTIGNLEFVDICRNSDITPISQLSENSQFYEYKIGFVPLEIGDYVFSWNNKTIISNVNRNLFILSDYPINGNPKALELNKCGSFSSIPNIDNSDSEYFFSVD